MRNRKAFILNVLLIYAILTNEMTKAWSGLSVKDYKKIKELTKNSKRQISGTDFLHPLISILTHRKLKTPQHEMCCGVLIALFIAFAVRAR